MKDNIIKIVLENQRAIGWNGLYAGKHWVERSGLKQQTYGELLQAKGRYRRLGKKPLNTRVKITITAYFVNSPLDPDNIAAKFYIDALKGWLLIDDTQQYISSVTTQSIVNKTENRVEIIIEPEIIDDNIKVDQGEAVGSPTSPVNLER